MTSDAARDLRAEGVVAAPPERVWELLSDLSRMGEWSPETVRMVPLKPGGLRVGQWYLGINRRGRVWWPTRSVLTHLEPGRRIGWLTTTSGAQWFWELEAAEGGTRVVHHRPVDKVAPGARLFAGLFLGGFDQHADDLEGDLQVSLDRMRAAAER